MDDYMKGYDRLIESKKIVDQMEAEKLKALMLRKQAEAVMDARRNFIGRGYAEVQSELIKFAQQLSQKADELEQ